MGTAGDTKYQLHDKVLCEFSGLYYEAKVIEVNDKGYKIHYQGWHKRHDETVQFDQTGVKFKPFSTEAHRQAKEEVKEAKSLVSAKKPKDENVSETSKTSSRSMSRPRAANVSADSKSVKRKLDDKVTVDSSISPYPDASKEPICELPNQLKQILVDDHYSIHGQKLLCKLPCEYSVDDIIKEYCAHLNQTPDDTSEIVIEFDNDKCVNSTVSKLITSSQGIVDYFDVLLSCQLLYKFERLQYNNRFEKEKNGAASQKDNSSSTDGNVMMKPSSVYGLPHLLRLLSKFDGYVKMTHLNGRMIKMLREALSDFMEFLVQNKEKYLDSKRDYQSTTSDYKKQAL